MSCESQTHLDAHGHGGRKLFETRELREKHVHESTRVESGDDDPICVTKEGGASGQSKKGVILYINYCSSSVIYPLGQRAGALPPQIPKYYFKLYPLRACGWGRYSDPNLPALRPVPQRGNQSSSVR